MTPDHLVKGKCLEIISDLTPTDLSGEVASNTLKLLVDFSHNQDPRVRAAALQAVVRHSGYYYLLCYAYPDVFRMDCRID